MSVGTFLQPDFETQSGTDYKTAIDGSFAVLSRIGAMFAPHEQATPDMTVRLDAGALLANVALTEVAAQSTGTITAPTGTDHRIDRVVIDALTGAASVITGTPGASPAAPAITTGKLPVCQVALAHGMTVITNDLITDERISSAGSSEAIKIDGIYPEISGVNPSSILGYGTWELIPMNGISQYPTQDTNHVKATSEVSASYHPWFATDPLLSLTGAAIANSWYANGFTPQRFHIDVGSAIRVMKVYYENSHVSGSNTERGVKDFTLWGSNDAAAFAELTYATDTNWTQLTTDISQMVIHTASDIADPQYIIVSNSVAYRYYAFKFANTWTSGDLLGVRRIELQTLPFFNWKRTA